MMPDDHDPTWHRLQRLTVIEPDPARSDRVRRRCRVAMAERPPHERHAIARPRYIGRILEPGLTYGLSVVYLSAIIYDVMRVYLRR